MAYVDFDTLIINRQRIDLDELKSTMHHFKSYGVRNFIITLDVDIETEFIATIIHNIKNIKTDIRPIKPFGCKVYIAPSVLYRPEIVYNDNLRRLLFKRTNKIFLHMPLACGFREDDFFKSINHLLYKLKYIPIFTRFEDVLTTYPNALSKKLYKTRSAVYSLDVNFLTKPIGTVSIFSAMNSDSDIALVPAISGTIKDYKAPELLFSDIKKRYDRSIYLKFCRFMNNSTRKILPL